MDENQLHNESSPYLIQHRDNPIHWRAWGEAAFREARERNKPIFLSIGYSTCHWCHVMAHESFEDLEVAKVLNENFISIKVDREERPDVDHVYMSALQTLSGGGGWPMSLWLTAEGKPFFAGTYFPKYRFLQLLRRIQEIWSTEPGRLLEDSERLTESIRKNAVFKPEDEDESDEAAQEEFLKTYITHFQHHFDETNGGFGGAPKFPQTMNLMVMMRQDRVTGLNQAETMVKSTLLGMLRGGMYDHLRGGFHRYSVDEKWLVPHFEKMLYDQALIVVTLIEAYQLYAEDEFARAARETCDYVLREMTHPEGGFYSAQDADSLNPTSSEMEEGYFCTFDYVELSQGLKPNELHALEKIYGVTPSGNFEGRNILNLQDGFSGESARSNPDITSAFKHLEELRASRPVPHLDDKVITAWNGWMIWAMIRAGLALEEPRYLAAASKALTFLSSRPVSRSWREGRSQGSPAAEDYTALIHAALEMYQADFNPKWAKWALELQATLDEKFWDVEEGNYFANDGKDSLLPLRPKEDYDGVTPSANSLASYNLARLYLLTGTSRFNHQAERLAQSLFAKLKRFPSGLPFLALALDFRLADARVVVTSGSDTGWTEDFLAQSRLRFEPHRLWAQADSEWPITLGKSGPTPSLYICREGTCLPPAQSADEARTQLI